MDPLDLPAPPHGLPDPLPSRRQQAPHPRWSTQRWWTVFGVASQAALSRAGFQQEGRLRNFLTINGIASDALVFAAIAPK